ncbi:caspase-3 [Parasteatoda tepidariorum]|uniref:caspase-3 n=1 Tax=Parasteatoda tepidariorum TaxID=114398 RepID=UPI00077FD59F|nr:caspase-3 [Parasteatoda tepidariorum]
MDPLSRQLIKQNEQLIKRLDIHVLRPHLKNSRIFTTSMLRDIYDSDSDCDLFSELPSRGPHAFSRFLEVLNKAGCKTEAINLMNGNDPNYAESEFGSVFYPMKSNPLGYCLIINNINFYRNGVEVIEKRREGSRVDAKRLRDFFEKNKYIVEKQTNLRCEKMKENMEKLAKSDVLKIVDCCFIIILSHGYYNNVIHDTHFCELRKQEVCDIFNNINCENLRGKPKIILFQACRGRKRDDGVFDENSDSLTLSEPDLDFSTECTDASLNINVSAVTNSSKYPKLSDMLIIHACLPDHVSYLDNFDGSWLIQDLLSVFKENFLVQDIGSMLTAVSRKMHDRLSLRGHKKQVLHVEYFGFRALFHICSNDDYEGPNKKFIRYLP